MSKSSTADPTPERAGKDLGQQQATALCLSVLNALGRPVNFFRISAAYLWENHFRVNVHTGDDATSVRVAHSFFVAVDAQGKVLESNPPIIRLY
jgi:hypothetical protein